MEPMDDSLDILLLTKKPYRQLIITNAVSMFDFRIYLFARQIQLLLESNQPVEALKRSKFFISSLSRTLSEYEISLIPFFTESWVYSACNSVVSQCDEVLAVFEYSKESMIAYQGLKAELLHFARLQLDSLGCISEMIPFSINNSPEHLIARKNQKGLETNFNQITNAELKDCLKNKQVFDDAYMKLTNRAIRSFGLGNRDRSVWALKNDNAYLYYYRSEYAKAAEIWESIASNYAIDKWTTLHTSILFNLSHCFKNLKLETEFVKVAIGLLSNFNVNLEDGFRFVDEISKYSFSMDTQISIESSVIFKFTTLGLINKVGDDQDIVADVLITSLLPCVFSINKGFQNRSCCFGYDW